MRLALIHPSNKDVYSGFARPKVKRMPVGLAYLAAFTSANGIDTILIDAEVSDLNVGAVIKKVQDFKPDVVGITCTTPIFQEAIDIAEAIKASGINTNVILGGPHITALPENSLETSNAVDFVVCGEGEITLLETLQALEQKEFPSRVKGLGFKRDGIAFINYSRERIMNLDLLPFPARELLPMDKYIDEMNFNEAYTLVTTSRGCPYNCIFCASVVTWGRNIKYRSVESIIAELKEIKTKFAISNITFVDDTLNCDRQRLKSLSSGIIDAGLDISFVCNMRVDNIYEDDLELLKKAGCKTIYFGIESANNEILKNIKKGITIEMSQRAVKLVKKVGIDVHGSFIFGNPGETESTVKETIEFALGLDLKIAQFNIATPFPGTQLWNLAKSKGVLEENNFKKHKMYYSVSGNLSDLSDEQLIYYQKTAYERFNKSKRSCE